MKSKKQKHIFDDCFKLQNSFEDVNSIREQHKMTYNTKSLSQYCRSKETNWEKQQQ